MTIRAIVHEEDGAFWAEVPELPGCFTMGDSLEEIEVNLREVIELHLSPDPAILLPTGARRLDLRFA